MATTLTIITINLNNRKGLQRTIDSIAGQSVRNFEWIVIDGGSTDGSVELIEANRKYIDFWVSEPDRGIYHAMNKGIDHAHGEYMQFLNSGDALFDEHTVEWFLQQSFAADVVYGNAVIVNPEGVEVSVFRAPEDIRLSYFRQHILNHQATFFSHRCFDSYRYNEHNRIASDVELYMHLVLHDFSFQKADRFIVRYDNSGISSKVRDGESEQVLNNVLPRGLRQDYEEIIQDREVDLAVMTRKIISSKRIYRNMARLFLYPIYWLARR